MKKILLISLLGIGSALLSACGPTYRTTYTFVPPKSWRGRQCLNKCLQTRSQCRAHCMHTHQLCRAEADVMGMTNHAMYEHRHKHEHHKHQWYSSVGWAGPSSGSVSGAPNYGHCQGDCGCQDDYKSCYQNCGGHIYSHTYCVSGCDKIKNHPKPMGVGATWK